MTTNSTENSRTSLRERHQRDLEAALARLKNSPSSISEDVAVELQGCLNRYRADGTARKDSILALFLAIVITAGWFGMLAAIGGVLATIWGIYSSKATWADLGFSVWAIPAMVWLFTRTNRWMDNISGARRAASGLKEYLRPLNKQLTERVHELISLSDGAREFHAGVLEKGGSLRYFHLQAMHAMTGTPTIEEEVDEMFEGPFAAVQQLLSVGLMLALFTATVWYSMFAGRH
jgi:signal transduction histidine kinase